MRIQHFPIEELARFGKGNARKTGICLSFTITLNGSGNMRKPDSFGTKSDTFKLNPWYVGPVAKLPAWLDFEHLVQHVLSVEQTRQQTLGCTQGAQALSEKKNR